VDECGLPAPSQEPRRDESLFDPTENSTYASAVGGLQCPVLTAFACLVEGERRSLYDSADERLVRIDSDDSAGIGRPPMLRETRAAMQEVPPCLP
jgi:hypothetical protein